jgi:hypothetical protein
LQKSNLGCFLQHLALFLRDLFVDHIAVLLKLLQARRQLLFIGLEYLVQRFQFLILRDLRLLTLYFLCLLY